MLYRQTAKVCSGNGIKFLRKKWIDSRIWLDYSLNMDVYFKVSTFISLYIVIRSIHICSHHHSFFFFLLYVCSCCFSNSLLWAKKKWVCWSPLNAVNFAFFFCELLIFCFSKPALKTYFQKYQQNVKQYESSLLKVCSDLGPYCLQRLSADK